ncbi:hypothetical protein GCM10010211_66210 [Streptomyces albospinus]|uniref:Secreted protein n=1 Tax=Streptomyces albospinus TaxID=285515 RepID=A0ABQ2VMQ5_9ACTN|nr:hypothetical protein GCM10010211_66210 [Streptomyces albospinus]
MAGTAFRCTGPPLPPVPPASLVLLVLLLPLVLPLPPVPSCAVPYHIAAPPADSTVVRRGTAPTSGAAASRIENDGK